MPTPESTPPGVLPSLANLNLYTAERTPYTVTAVVMSKMLRYNAVEIVIVNKQDPGTLNPNPSGFKWKREMKTRGKETQWILDNPGKVSHEEAISNAREVKEMDKRAIYRYSPSSNEGVWPEEKSNTKETLDALLREYQGSPHSVSSRALIGITFRNDLSTQIAARFCDVVAHRTIKGKDLYVVVVPLLSFNKVEGDDVKTGSAYFQAKRLSVMIYIPNLSEHVVLNQVELQQLATSVAYLSSVRTFWYYFSFSIWAGGFGTPASMSVPQWDMVGVNPYFQVSVTPSRAALTPDGGSGPPIEVVEVPPSDQPPSPRVSTDDAYGCVDLKITGYERVGVR